jgi:hypothetical protein
LEFRLQAVGGSSREEPRERGTPNNFAGFSIQTAQITP